LRVSLKEKGRDFAAHCITFAIVYGFLLSYFPPSYLLLKTITTGGDTPSQYAAADYLIHTLIPSGKIMGWMPGNLAGFPLFQFYFPLPFFIIALLHVFMPLQIAFKLVTVMGTFLLPLCAYGCLRLLRQSSPIPLIGAIFTLPFLFMEANSVWGGNIPSTLSGEFAYSLGISLLVLYIGSFYRGITENRYICINALLLAAIGLCHGYTLIIGVVAPTFFLFTATGFLKNLGSYLKVNILAFLLLGFWLIQLLWFLPYTTPFNFVWILEGISQVFPKILLPCIAFAVGGLISVLLPIIRSRRTGQEDIYINLYLWFGILAAGLFYFIAYKINLVDIRFLPYTQVLLLLLGSMGIGSITQRMKFRLLLAPFLAILIVLWVNQHINYIPQWIKWNYSGFETKSLWPQFYAVNRYLKGSYQDPRVVYEHDVQNQAVGSIRAFESLPFFSGRSTLEGLYIQSSITSPFIFYLQSEISSRPSCPLPDYNYSRINLERGLEHLKLFNVSHFITITDKVREAIEKNPHAIREKDFPPYTVYRLNKNPETYVSLLHHEPPLVITKNWRGIAFEWFRRGDLKTHLVFKEKFEPPDTKLFKTIISQHLREGQIPKIANITNSINPTSPIPQKDSTIKEMIRPQEIIFTSPHKGRPHLVRVSYHPNWHVEGADRIYLASPSFMLVYPTQERVRLYFGRSLPHYIGWVCSFMGLLIFLAGIKPFRNLTVIRYSLSVIRNLGAYVGQISAVGLLLKFRYKKQLLWGASVSIICVLVFIVLMLHHNDPVLIHNKGMDYFKRGDYSKARLYFEKGMRSFPLSTIIDETAFHFAITYFKERNWQKALEAFEQIAQDYPESRKFPQVLYHIGLCQSRLKREDKAIKALQRLVKEFPEDTWAVYARERLGAMGL
jgi:hypothetical protein